LGGAAAAQAAKDVADVRQHVGSQSQLAGPVFLRRVRTWAKSVARF
jgi:hypothetical protein